MTRRQLVKSAAVLGITAALPESGAVAEPIIESEKPGGFFKFKLGDLQLLVVSDGYMHFPQIQPTMAPHAAKEEIEEVLRNRYVPTDSLNLGLNILIVQKDGRIILFDTGCGSLYGPTCGKLVANLEEAGFRAAEITDIVLTHAHGDHLGGLLTENGEFVFPNASVYVSEIEFKFWMQAPDFSKSLVSKEKAKSMVGNAQRILSKLGQKLIYYNNGEMLFDCMEIEIAPGHTPGHAITRIFSGAEEMTHLADIAHSHTILLAHPEWGNSFDADFEQAVRTRKQVLSRMTSKRQRVFSYHFPWPGVGFIKANGDGFEWVPQSFSTSVS